MEEKKEFQIEEAFKELEEIIERLESDAIPLKDSLTLYSQGAKLVTACKNELEGIEKEMIIIGESME